MAEKETGTLHERAQWLLINSEQTYLEIFKATDIPPHWLTLFAGGKTPDPSVNRVQKLYEYLSGHSLPLI